MRYRIIAKKAYLSNPSIFGMTSYVTFMTDMQRI